jgi:hypothetical protein
VGTAVWVEGEPGIGKSSLVVEALSGATELGWDIGWRSTVLVIDDLQWVIAPGNATTGTITFPLTVDWDGLEKTRKVSAMSGSGYLAKNRAGRPESEKADGALAGTLIAADRCDRCGAQAYVRVLLPSRLELLFCAHHNRQYAPALAKIAVEIRDETERLARTAA